MWFADGFLHVPNIFREEIVKILRTYCDVLMHRPIELRRHPGKWSFVGKLLPRKADGKRLNLPISLFNGIPKQTGGIHTAA